MPKTVICIRVDPIRKSVTRIVVKPSTAGMRRLLGASELSARVLLEDVGNGDGLAVGSRVNVNRDHPFKEWRLRGGENTVGIGILFGLPLVRTEKEARETGKPIGTRLAGGMWHCPVDIAWVQRRIVWCEPGEDAPAEEVREELGVPDPDAA
jgi:hypothetical protein